MNTKSTLAPGSTVVEAKGGHAIYLSHPQAVIGLIERAATGPGMTCMFSSVLEAPRDHVHLRLGDSRCVTIRPVLPSDLDALRTFFATLSRATLRLRFLCPINELSEHLLRGFAAVNQRAHVAFVAEFHGAAGQIVAEARFVRGSDSESAEFALVVADGWRRIGLGTMLTRILARRARFAGLHRLCGDVLEDNMAMRGFAHSLGARWSQVMRRGLVRLSLEV